MLTLRESVDAVGQIARASEAYPMASFVQIEGDGSTCVVTAFDGLIRARAEAASDFRGRACVDAKKLSKALSTLGAVAMTSKGGKLTIVGNGRLTIASVEQKIEPPAPAKGAHVDGTALRRSVEKVKHAVSADTSKPFASVLLEKRGRAVALDGRRVTYAPAPDGISILLPAPTIALALSMHGTELTIGETETRIVVSDGALIFECPKLVGDFPPYEQAMFSAKPTHACGVKKALLVEALSVAMLAGETYVRLQAAGKEMVVSSEDGETGAESTIKVECDGPMACEIAIEQRFLSDAIGALDGDSVCIHTFADERKPILLTGSAHPLEVSCSAIATVNLSTRLPKSRRK